MYTVCTFPSNLELSNTRHVQVMLCPGSNHRRGRGGVRQHQPWHSRSGGVPRGSTEKQGYRWILQGHPHGKQMVRQGRAARSGPEEAVPARQQLDGRPAGDTITPATGCLYYAGIRNLFNVQQGVASYNDLIGKFWKLLDNFNLVKPVTCQ